MSSPSRRRSREVRPWWRAPFPYGRRLFLTVTAVALTVLAIGAFFAVRAYRAERQAAVDALADLSQTAGRSADRFVRDRVEFLQGIAASPAVQQGDRRGTRQLLRAMLGDRVVFDNIGWVSADGRGAIIPNLPLDATAALDLSDRDYIQAVRATGRPFVSDALLGAIRSEPFVVLAVPVFDRTRRLVGIVTGGVRLSASRPPVSALPGSRTVQIVDRAGNVIAGGRPIQRLQPVANRTLLDTMRTRRAGVLVDVDGLDGTSGQVVAYTGVDRAGWTVVASRSADSVFASPRTELLLRVGTWFGFVVVALTVVWWLARRLDRLAEARATRTAEFAEAAAALSAATTVEEIVGVVEDRGRSLLGADEVVVTLVEGDRLVARYGRPSPDRSGRRELPTESITGEAVVTGRRVEVCDPADMEARFSEVAATFHAAGLAAAVAVPLPRVAAVGPGSLGVGFAVPKRLREDEWQLVESLAERVGQAIARARLYEQERRARTRAERNEHRLQRLQHFTAALANTNAVDFDLVVARLRRATEAAIVAGVQDGDDRTVEGDDDLRAIGSAMLESWPEGSADGIQIWSDASSMRGDRTLPPLERRGVEALVALSIRPAQTPAAVVMLGLDHPLESDEEAEERSFLALLARQAALALERGALARMEHEATERTIALQRLTAISEKRFRALVDASTSIVWSTDAAGAMRERSVSWERFTGQRPDQYIGSDWGWLDAIHPDDRERNAELWREAIELKVPYENHYRLRRSDGTYRRVVVKAVPVLDAGMGIREWIGSNTDVETELVVREALDLERSSRLEAERRARGRAELLAETMSALEQVAGVEARAQMLVDILVPRVADYASIEVPGASTPVLAQAHRSRRGLRVLRALRERHRLEPDDRRSIERAAAGEIQLIETITPEMLAEYAVDPDVAALLQELGPRSHVALPLTLGGAHRGAILLGLSDTSRRPYAPADVEFLGGLVERAGVLLANARIQEEEHQIALRLQRALLPAGPITHPQAEIAARYEPGSTTLEVGGDWYDTFLLDDDRIGIGVGDVVGHGLESAAAMGRLRSSMATLATNGAGPAELLSGLARFAVGAGQVDFATALYATLDPEERTIRYAYAGHPPILVVSEGGETRWLEDGRSGAIGDDRTRYESEATASLEPGDLLLVYSDGLVERRGEGISVGLARLETVAAEGWELPVRELCDQILQSLGVDRQRDDDVVLLCLRLLPVDTRTFTCRFPAISERLAPVRSQLRAWLAEGRADPSCEQALLLAVGEACSNAVEHAYLDRPVGEIDLQIRQGPDGFTVRVHDGGTWRGDHDEDDRGRGSAIMHALSDEFRRETDDTGTTVTMRILVPRHAHT